MKILTQQAFLQERYAKLKGLPDPSKMEGRTVGEVLDYIKEARDFVNDEINELMVEIGGGRQALKPWSTQYQALRDIEYKSTALVKAEAVDALCFMMNILLTAGLTSENVDAEYYNVFEKNVKRQNDKTY
jgi:hypothetical protein